MSIIEYLMKFDLFANMMSNLSEKTTKKIADKNALSTFQLAAKKVPAYQEILRKEKINPDKIKSISDFKKLPILDKDKYIIPNKMEDFLINDINTFFTYGSSSGSKGRPLFWPSMKGNEQMLPYIISRYYKSLWQIEKIKTLLIISYPMGAWVGSIKSAAISLEIAREFAYPLTVMVPGASLEDTKRYIKEFGSHYEQIIILSFPMFFRNLVDEKEINWASLNVKFFGSGEFISEAWRDYISKIIAPEKNDLNTITSLYSAAELGGGLIGFENIFTNLLRKLAKKNTALARDLFGNTKIPVIVQYTPMSYYLEIVDSKLIITSKGGAPFVRYSIKDKAKIVSFSEIEKILIRYGYNYMELLKKYKSAWYKVNKLPFLFVYGRADDTVIFNGVNIYYPSLEGVLYKKSTQNYINSYLTEIRHDEEQREQFVVIFELKRNVKLSDNKKENLKENLSRLVIEELKEKNADYADEYAINPDDTKAFIEIYSYNCGPFESKKLKKKII